MLLKLFWPIGGDTKRKLDVTLSDYRKGNLRRYKGVTVHLLQATETNLEMNSCNTKITVESPPLF